MDEKSEHVLQREKNKYKYAAHLLNCNQNQLLYGLARSLRTKHENKKIIQNILYYFYYV